MKLEKKRGAFRPTHPPRFNTTIVSCVACVLLLSLGLGNANAQEKTTKAIQEELKEVQRGILAAEQSAQSDPRVVAKHLELKEGFQEYARFQKTFPPLAAAYEEMYAAKDHLHDITRERAKTFPAAMEQQAIIDATDDRVRALRWDMTIARMQFLHPDAPFQRMVDGDPNYIALAAGKEPPNVESPEVKEWMMKTPLPEVRRAILLAIPEAKDLSVQLKSWSNEIAQVETDLIKAKTKLSQVRQNMQNGDDPVALAAKRRLDASLDEVSRTRNLPEFIEVRDRKRARQNGIKKLVVEIAREDPTILALVERRDALQKILSDRAQEMSRRSRPQIPPK